MAPPLVTWLEVALEARVVEAGEDGRLRVDPGAGALADAVLSDALRARKRRASPGDRVIVRPTEDGGHVAMWIYPRDDGPEFPLLVPSVDPDVEYLLEPGQEEWSHPEKPRLYDWYDAWDEDLPMWRRLATEADGPVLEMACGTGRVTIDLARAGFTVTGVDYSREMLDFAAEKLAFEPEEVRRRVDLVLGDATTWRDERRYALAFLGCNGVHYLGHPQVAALHDARGESIRTLFAHLRPGGRAAISNWAAIERKPRPEVHPSPRLLLQECGRNPHTGRFTATYRATFVDSVTGNRIAGPWRFCEPREDGSFRMFEFAAPPETPDEPRVREWPETLTREETVGFFEEAGFRDVEMLASPDLRPVTDADGVVVFVGRRGEAS